jgi:hypothetical protein
MKKLVVGAREAPIPIFYGLHQITKDEPMLIYIAPVLNYMPICLV